MSVTFVTDVTKFVSAIREHFFDLMKDGKITIVCGKKNVSLRFNIQAVYNHIKEADPFMVIDVNPRDLGASFREQMNETATPSRINGTIGRNYTIDVEKIFEATGVWFFYPERKTDPTVTERYEFPATDKPVEIHGSESFSALVNFPGPISFE